LGPRRVATAGLTARFSPCSSFFIASRYSRHVALFSITWIFLLTRFITISRKDFFYILRLWTVANLGGVNAREDLCMLAHVLKLKLAMDELSEMK
jgi:hypothetical protein